MQRFFLRLSFFIAIVFSIINWSCTKVDTTTMGSDLLPAVDNVHTFADTLSVVGTQGLYTSDSTTLSYSDYHALGNITNDPVFGKTQASVFFELKPINFPYHIGGATDTINPLLVPGTGFDSAVLCLSVKGYYGDTNSVQHLRAYMLDNTTTNFKYDSSYHLSFQPNGNYQQIGETYVKAAGLYAYQVLKDRKDSVYNQIRIPLSNAFLTQLLGRDSTTNGINNAFHSDSAFKKFYKGFAVMADPTSGNPNGLFYIGLTDANTRLEIHYRRKYNSVIDTTFSSFTFSTTSVGGFYTPSAHANNLTRDRNGADFNPPVSPSSSSDALYIQSTPGSYAKLKIPRLTFDSLSNRIIHRAELIIQQIPDLIHPNLDGVMLPPTYLYLDLFDSGSVVRNKPIYYDLNPTASYDPDNSFSFFPSGGIDFNYFGGVRLPHVDPSGATTYSYNFNISQYVQHIVTNHNRSYDMRITAPFSLNYAYNIAFNNSVAYGRVKIGNGNHANPKYRMFLRIVYSKI